MASGKFATAISCMDGRIQNVISDWIKQNYNVDHVDTITAPGVDKRVAEQTDIMPLVKMTQISIQKHKSRLVVVSGHYDCAGNPVSDREHKNHIKTAINVIKLWEDKYGLLGATVAPPKTDSIKVVGIWIGEEWTAQTITEKEEQNGQP